MAKHYWKIEYTCIITLMFELTEKEITSNDLMKVLSYD